MKRPAMFICFILIFFLSACGNVNKGANNNYKDGVYGAEGEKWQYGYETSVVTIKVGKIANVVLKRLDLEGKEVNYDEWTGAQGTDSKIKPNLKEFRVDMAKRMVEMQTYDVDTISTATQSSIGWKLATQKALESAKK